MTYVSRLRLALGDGCVVTQDPGYRLDVAGDGVDAARFERLVKQARAVPRRPRRSPSSTPRSPSGGAGLRRVRRRVVGAAGRHPPRRVAHRRRRAAGRRAARRRRVQPGCRRARRAGGRASVAGAARQPPDEGPCRRRPPGRGAADGRAFRKPSPRRPGSNHPAISATSRPRSWPSAPAAPVRPARRGATRSARRSARARSARSTGRPNRVGREVAVKVIRAELADDPEFVRRFEAEAQLVARLEHPHIVPLYDYWREPGGAYLVFRLLRGRDRSHDRARRTARSTVERVDAGCVTEIGCSAGRRPRRRRRPPRRQAGERALRRGAATPTSPTSASPPTSWRRRRRAPPAGPRRIATSAPRTPPEQLSDGGPPARRPTSTGWGRCCRSSLDGRASFATRRRPTTCAPNSERPVPSVRPAARPPRRVDVASARHGEDPQTAYATVDATVGPRAARERRRRHRGSPRPRTRDERQPAAVATPTRACGPSGRPTRARFFGPAALVARLRRRPGARRFVAVVGPSGRGSRRSCYAGLVPRTAASRDSRRVDGARRRPVRGQLSRVARRSPCENPRRAASTDGAVGRRARREGPGHRHRPVRRMWTLAHGRRTGYGSSPGSRHSPPTRPNATCASSSASAPTSSTARWPTRRSVPSSRRTRSA